MVPIKGKAMKILFGRKDSFSEEKSSPQYNTDDVHSAARSGHKDFVKTMVQELPKSVVFGINERGETPLHVAARAGHIEVVQILVGCSSNSTTTTNNNNNNNIDAQTGKKEGHDCDIIVEVKDMQAKSEEAQMEFSRDIEAGEIEKHNVESEVEHNVLKMKDKYGNTPLHSAVRNNCINVVSFLAREDPELLVLLNTAGESPLSIAIDLKLYHTASIIMETNAASLGYRGPFSRTLLHSTVIRNDIGNMKMILKHSEKEKWITKELDSLGMSSLHYAAALGHVEMVRELLKLDVSPAHQGDKWGQLPLHLAAKNGRVSVLKVLLDGQYSNTIELYDNKRRNVLHFAAQYGNLNVVTFIMDLDLTQRELDFVNASDKEGNTPLHLAAKHLHSSTVYLLSKNRRVDIRAKNENGKTALEIVQSSKCSGMEKHLTLKALKTAFAKRGLQPEHILENRITDFEKKSSQDGNGKEMAQTLSVISMVVATFTFTAAFTIPGGFKSDGPDEGMAMLINRAAFKAFVITDTIAMTSSMTAAVLVLWSLSRNKDESFWDSLPFAIVLTWIGLVAMSLAFVSGLFTVLSNTLWLAIVACVIGCAPPFILYVFAPLFLFVFDLLSSSAGRQRNIVNENPFLFIFRLVKMMT